MHYDYPIEQLARSARTRFQLGFARFTMKLLPSFDDVLFEPSAQGLRMLAATETALTIPGEVIRQMHANEVEIDKPSVRLQYEGQVLEPIMWVRVSVGHAVAEPVLQDLIAREGHIEEADWGHPRTIIRARAPLRRLLGYAQTLSRLSDPGADVQMWLSHYQRLPQGPGGDAA
jgi:predicted membrane GTPase involved in stress response